MNGGLYVRGNFDIEKTLFGKEDFGRICSIYCNTKLASVLTLKTWDEKIEQHRNRCGRHEVGRFERRSRLDIEVDKVFVLGFC